MLIRKVPIYKGYSKSQSLRRVAIDACIRRLSSCAATGALPGQGRPGLGLSLGLRVQGGRRGKPAAKGFKASRAQIASWGPHMWSEGSYPEKPWLFDTSDSPSFIRGLRLSPRVPTPVQAPDFAEEGERFWSAFGLADF